MSLGPRRQLSSGRGKQMQFSAFGRQIHYNQEVDSQTIDAYHCRNYFDVLLIESFVRDASGNRTCVTEVQHTLQLQTNLIKSFLLQGD